MKTKAQLQKDFDVLVSSYATLVKIIKDQEEALKAYAELFTAEDEGIIFELEDKGLLN